MYQDAEKAIQRILKVVDSCPEKYQELCFKVLLEGYAQSHFRSAAPGPPAPPGVTQKPPPPPPRDIEHQIPEELQSRFKTTAKRLDIPVSDLAALFDFNAEPFTFHAVTVPGDNNAERTRNVVLLVAGKSYLTTGSWTADWKEIKARCVDQNCYDHANHSSNLKKEKAWFKSVDVGKQVELSTGGIKEAEKLLKQLVTED